MAAAQFEITANMFNDIFENILVERNLMIGEEDAGIVQYLFNIDLACAIFQRFIFDYLSERINDCNSHLQTVIYDSPWYHFSPKMRKDILMMLKQSQCDQFVLTGYTFPFNLQTFSLILQKIYSIFTVLHDMM
uniref:CSON013106 protein n=1 Tax=Culicoides sonorensis TaxID=179676 RepID=A0A336KRQ8_CULSO